ncbi:MAG: hypothetical protein PHH93_11460 [Prolixibacteraceae bacterium]|nr:hypothetical protein [Prolixibacteraceae bacterium]
MDEEEINTIEKLSKANAMFNEEYNTKKIALHLNLCKLVEDVIQMSYFLSMNYRNVALKNFDGSFMVNELVTGS